MFSTAAIASLLLCVAAAVSQAQSLPEQLIQSGHWKRARAIVEPLLRESPNDPLANSLTSQIRNAFGDHASPLGLAEKAVALDGSTAKYHRQLAEVLGVTAQHAGIWQQLVLARRFRKEIEAALALDGRNIQALRDLMEFYLLAPGIAGGDQAKAAATAERIMAIDAAEGFLAQARLAESQHLANRIEGLLRHAVAVQPVNYHARMALAEFGLSPDHADLPLAEEQAREALQLDRERVDAYRLLAEVYAVREQWTELDATLAAAARNVPDDAAPWYRAAARLLASGRDLPRAERCLRTYLSQEPEGNEPASAEAHWKLGQVLQREGRVPEAIVEWKESVRLDPASPARRELKSVRDESLAQQ